MAVWSEFQPLESVVLGSLFPTDELLDYLDLAPKWADGFRYINDTAISELDEISRLLESRGINVVRPLPHPLKTHKGPAGPSLSPRDWMFVYGNIVLNGNDAFVNHHDRCKTTQHVSELETRIMPTHGMWANCSFDELTSYDLRRPYMHTANFLRCGHDLFYSNFPGRTGNSRGLEWMIDNIKLINPQARFHAVECEEHLDGSLFLVRPGLAITNLDMSCLPPILQKWEIIIVDDVDNEKAYEKTLAYKYKKLNPVVASEYSWFLQSNPDETYFSINALSINESTVIFPGSHPKLFDALEAKGIECLSVDMRAVSFWDSGLHCSTSELARSGDIQDYS